METILIKRTISKEQFDAMSDTDISEIVQLYCGTLLQIEQFEDVVTLHIIAPSTWKTCLIQNFLLPYRYI